MEIFINYLMESSIILGILTLFYRFVLHHEPLFKFNRFYLLFSLLLATVAPFIHISLSSGDSETTGFVLLETVNVFSGDVRETVVPVIKENKSFTWIYGMGAIGLLVRLLLGIVRLGGLSKKATWVKYNGIRIADLPGKFNPFSFFHVIFINRSLYSDDDLDKILVHETAHVKYRHSLDVLLFEILLIVQWFNPFAWMIKYLLKELHEFQADRSVLQKGTSIGSYKNLLLFQATGARLLPVNNFNQSITKKRFKMMTNKTLKNKAFVKTLAATLMIVGVGFFFACDNELPSDIEGQDETLSLKSATDNNGFLLGDSSRVYFVVDSMPKFPGGDKALRKFIAQNVKYPLLCPGK
ncbi:M56 family metallopeptidase [Saccharicrinis sp. 156]|uniref:M56 family metallopeptidase n=1 Tax=Saccharicrinis sp. 156 TaxID=3417574 RepID=UPI003D354F13